MLIHPDLWEPLVDLLRDYEDAVIAQERLDEAMVDPSVLIDLKTPAPNSWHKDCSMAEGQLAWRVQIHRRGVEGS
ncbi:MAG: hypothetical protein R2856_15285 [Caldilineaceae bacterium]